MEKDLLKLGCTSGLMGLVEQNPQFKEFKEVVRLFEAVRGYKQQIEDNLGIDVLATIEDLYELTNNLINSFDAEDKAKIKCKAGCAHCCHIRVDISAAEADFIVHYCKLNEIPFDVNVLLEQRNTTIKERPRLANSACVFLDERSMCMIYKARPMGCRKYLVVSDPDKCNVVKWPGHSTATYTNIDIELMASGLLNASRGGEMADQLLNALKRNPL